MLTVPANAACSWEQEMVTGGNSRTSYRLSSSMPMAQATTVSVISGRKVLCCSKLPMGSTAVCGLRSRICGDVAVVSRSTRPHLHSSADLSELGLHVRYDRHLSVTRKSLTQQTQLPQRPG